MSAARHSDSEPQKSDISKTVARQPSHPGRLLRVLLRVGLLLAVAVALVMILVGGWMLPREISELPEIPSVNLAGSDPAIAKQVQAAREVVVQSPRSGILWGRYAMVLHAHGFADAAHIGYDAATRLEPKNPLWPYLQGDLYLEGSIGPAEALPYFELAAGLSPPESLPRLRMAETLLELGRLDEAEREYRKVLVVKQDPRAQLGLGRLAVARRQYREAVVYLQTAAELPQVQKTACTLLASVLDRLGERTSADAARARSEKMPPDPLRTDDPVHQVLQFEVGIRAELAKAQRLMEQDRVGEMLEVVEGLVHRYPESFEAWDALSIARELDGDLAGAERAARKSIQLVPKNAEAWLGLGKIMIGQRRFQDAVEPLQRSIALNPRGGEAYFSLGECRRGLGEFAAAAEAYRQTIHHMPDHSAARKRLEEMQISP
jgi:tetratricopeptide (TPR) repeat protein